MSMDYLIRATAADAQVRIFAASTKHMTEEMRSIHDTSPVVTAALGRLLTGGALMGAMLKGEKDLLTLQVKGDGPLGGMTVTADASGNVKGYANHPQVILPASPQGKLDVGRAVGKGYLSVIKDLGLKEPYVGQTVLQTGEIAEDLTYYFASSEQTPSSVGLGVLMEKTNQVRQAGGFVIQLMPFAEDSVVEQIERNLSVFGSVTSVLDQGLSPEEMILRLMEGLPVQMGERSEVRYSCNCSREKVERAIISIGKQEIDEMILEDKDIHVNCHFCNKDYVFSVSDLQGMKEMSQR